MRDAGFVRGQPVGVRHVGDGLAVPDPTDAAKRVGRRIFWLGAQRLCWPYRREWVEPGTGEIKSKAEFGLCLCGRAGHGTEVRITRRDESVGLSGVYRCGNVWGCLPCQTKITAIRSLQLQQLFDHVHAAGGSVLMVTFTAAHELTDGMAWLLDRFKAAQQMMARDGSFRRLTVERHGLVVATEFKWSAAHGAHWHQHQCWTFPFSPAPDPEWLAGTVFPIWRRVCKANGLDTQEFFRSRRVGVDARVALSAADYLAKFCRERTWGLNAEMTLGRLKHGSAESLTSWDLLEAAIIQGRGSWAEELWIEYLRATKRKSWLSLKGCRKLLMSFGLPTTYDDFADANAIGDGEVVGTISSAEYDAVIRAGGLGSLLEAARGGGVEGLRTEIQSLSTSMEVCDGFVGPTCQSAEE